MFFLYAVVDFLTMYSNVLGGIHTNANLVSSDTLTSSPIMSDSPTRLVNINISILLLLP